MQVDLNLKNKIRTVKSDFLKKNYYNIHLKTPNGTEFIK